jgi:putative DNA primase/helicase
MTDNIQEQMPQRIQETEAELAKKPGKEGPGDSGLDPEFVQACLNRNERGDGEIFKKLYRNEFVFNASMDHWMRWVGHHWEVDKLKFASASVEGVAKVYENEGKRLSSEISKLQADQKTDENGDQIKRLAKLRKVFNDRAWKLRGGARQRNCVQQAQASEDPLAIDGQEIDQQPYKLACANGVVDLVTGELEKGRPEDYLLKASPVAWPEDGINADMSEWEGVLLEIFNGRQPLVDFLRQVVGLSLIGKVREAILVVLTGKGRNGKSLLIETLSKVLGPLAGAIRAEMLLDQFRVASSSGPSPDVMALRGLRMAFASETDENCRVSTSKVKWLTGNDELVGRNPHDKYDQYFMPSHTLWLLTNHLPAAPADDFAFWERVIVFPFDVSFVNRAPKSESEKRADPRLSEKLERLQPNILAWAVRGCLEYQVNGLVRPAAVVEATGKYHDDMDSLSDFIDACCVVGDQYTARAKHLYEAFAPWWEENVSKKVPTPKRFGQLLSKRFETKKYGVIYYIGIGLLEES